MTGAQAAATGVTIVVADRGVADQLFPGRTDDRRVILWAEPLMQSCLRIVGRQAPQLMRRFDSRNAFVDDENRRRRASAHDHQRIHSRPFRREREMR